MSHNWKSSSTLALIALTVVTAVWGSTFLVVRDAVSRMPVMDFIAIRFSAAALVMFAIRPNCLKGVTRKELMHAVVLGLVLGMGYVTQTWGLVYASATVSGFITGMFVVFTPVVSYVLLKRRTDRKTWFSVILATIGLGLLSLNGWSVGFGELLTLFCALFFALQIVGLGEWSSKYEPFGFALLQIATVAVISLIVAVPDGLTLPPDLTIWGTVVLTAVFATAAAFFVQTWAQSLVSPARTAVVMTMEPVFSGLFAVLIGGDALTWWIAGGGACVLAAMFIVQLRVSPFAKGG
jgi:drug/metabolite transporter (DMT)-like permease